MGDLPPEAPPADSILNNVKKVVGVEDSYDGFDAEIIFAINSAFMFLNQLGVGPSECFSITDETAVWGDFLDDVTNLEAVKSYVCLRTRLLFDPPTTSFVLEAINRQITEYEWRLSIQAEETPPTS